MIVYCVFDEDYIAPHGFKDIIGRFTRKNKADDYMKSLQEHGMNVSLKEMTKEEYKNYMRKFIDLEFD